MRKLFAELSKQEIAKSPNNYVLLGDISVGAFLDKEDNLPERVFNMGIAEQAMIGFAAGLSSAGGNVIVHTIAAFLVERAFEQIKLCCGYNNAKLTLISANGPYDYDKLGPTHHCASDVPILSTIPDFNIRLPATLDDMRECYTEAMASDSSTYIRMTSRAAQVDDYTHINATWRRVNNKNSKTAVVCIGESLTYQLAQNSDLAIYWTINPVDTLPAELDVYDEIIILEPYTMNLLQIPESFHCKTITRRCFGREHKKIMVKNMGWEDFKIG